MGEAGKKSGTAAREGEGLYDLRMEPLTPNETADIGIYAEALDSAFDMPEVRNIALMGPYGAGKSTVFRSYFNRRSAGSSGAIRVETISLAHFHGVRDDVAGECLDERERSTKHLEGEIIGQLVLKLDPKSVAQSRFHRPIRANRLSMAFYATLMVLVLFLTAIATRSVPVPQELIVQMDYGWISLLAAALAALFGGLLLYKLLMTQRRMGLVKRVSAHSYSFEVFDDEEDSFFDRHLREVLYLFENSGCLNFAFEDLDRYGNVQIFEQLHKVNDLLNARNKDKIPYRFFYLVRDGLFEGRERTKFFDLIIPVVPYVDNKNSLDLLSRRLVSSNRAVERKVLALISLFVDDMRTLQNICNEFLVYSGRIGESTYLNQEKLISFILYKNLYPRDYDRLCRGCGALNVLFDRNIRGIASLSIGEKKRSLRDEVERLMGDLEEGEAKDLASIKSRVAECQKELRWLDSCDPAEYLQSVSVKGMMGESEEVSGKVSKLLAESLYLSGDIAKSTFDQCARDEALAEVPGCTDADLKRRAAEEVKFGCHALYSLIENGLIDENYHDYVSYFHEGYLAKDDKKFIRYVVDGKLPAFDLPLKNPDEVIAELTEVDFAKASALNYRLMERVLDTNNETALCCMARRIAADLRFDFISGFFNWISGQPHGKAGDEGVLERATRLVTRLAVRANVESDNGLMERAVVGDGASDDAALDFIRWVLWGSEPELFELFSRREALQQMLCDRASFVRRLATEPERFENALECLSAAGVVFLDMRNFKSDRSAVDAVVERGLFAFNARNIEFLMGEYYDAQVHWAHYLNMLHREPVAPLSARIAANMDEFVALVIEQTDVIDCTAEAALPFLQSSTVREELKKAFIAKLGRMSFDLRMVNDQGIEPLLLERGLVMRSADNLMWLAARAEGALSDQVRCFVNNAAKFNFNIMRSYDEREAKKAIDALLLSDGINQRVLKDALSAVGHRCMNFELLGVAEENMGTLVESSYLVLNEHNLSFIRGNYPEFAPYFIGANPQEYAICLSEGCSPMPGELEHLLSWSGVTDEDKIDCLDYANAPISVQDVTVSDRILLKILKEHFDPNDLSWAIRNYDNQDRAVKEAIADIVEASLAEGSIRESQRYPADLLIELSSRNVGRAAAFKVVLAYNVRNMDLASFMDIVEVSSDEDLNQVGLSVGSGKRPQVKKTSEMVLLLAAIQSLGWISSFRAHKDTLRIYGRARS